MNQPKPPPQTLRPDDERKIQVFLERASSIVLERPVLDLTHWRRLVLLAEELGLSDEELRSTVNDLRHRGVIAEIDLSPPKPPPLPSQQGSSDTAATAQPGPERNFSLTPPPPPPQCQPQPGTASRPGKGTSPPPQVPCKPDAVELSHEERLRQYLERAQVIIAEQRGFGRRTHALLAATADELGLSDEQAANALRSIRREPALSPPPPPTADRGGEQSANSDAETDEGLQDSRRWRVEGAPPPEPPPPTRKPEAIYRDYLSASMAQITDGVVPRMLENKFIKHGTSVLGLAQTFARHLVSEEAAEKGLRFESTSAGVDSELVTPAAGADDELLCDANVKLFLERSAPILAQHRGINVKSRVLLNALASELGLSEEQVERAIAASQFRATTPREDADALQQERLVGFRDLVQGALISLPRKLLTFDVQENLCRHGEERHGIKPELVASVIRDVCAALDIRQITEQQAREHVEQLVDAKLGEHARLPQDVGTRIESEGKQWGLNAEQVASIIKERARLHDQRNRSERRLTHLALLAASLAALIVMGFFGWVASRHYRAAPSVIEEIAEQPGFPTPIVVEETKVDTAWWGEELEFAVRAARGEMRPQRPLFIQIESKEPSTRRSAYGKLMDELFVKDRENGQRDLLIRVISLCYAREPDEPNARHILDRLLTRIPKSERDLRTEETLYRHAFLATRAVVALVTQSSAERERDASTELARAIGPAGRIDASREPAAVQQQAYQGLAQRLYRLLPALAKSEPARVESIRAVIAAQSAGYLETASLEKLNTDFLKVVLLEASHTWREYKSLILEAVASKDPLKASPLLNVYEKTKDAELQAFLTEAWLERLGEAPESRDVASVAKAVRKSLGIAAAEVDNARLARFLDDANTLLGEPRAETSEPEALLAEMVRLVYYSTLGCAVAQGAAGDATFDKLEAQDPTALLNSEEPAAPLVRDEPKSLEPTSLRMLNERLTMLLNPRTNPVARFGFIETIAGFTDRIDDLAPEQAAKLATYLVSKKRIEEHRAILPRVEDLRQWKQVRLAVADRLEGSKVSREQLQEIISKLLGREYELGSGDKGLDATRVELLLDVLADAKNEDVADQDKYHVYDRAAQALYDFYTAQANLLGTAKRPDTPITPTVVAPAMIDIRVKQLLASKLAEEEKKQVQQIDVDVRAIDYLAANDLQKLALLDRAWLRLLAVEAAHKHPARKAEAVAIVEKLANLDRDTQHILIQLRNGHESILRLWMLLNRSN